VQSHRRFADHPSHTYPTVLEHACFISFSRGQGKDSLFANCFFDEFCEHLAALDKTLSVFKYDRCDHRQQGAAWDAWIQRELCHSAMMIAICAPNYFQGSPGCVSEFRGMEQLIVQRSRVLTTASADWLVALRLKGNAEMPLLAPYNVLDFLDCFATPNSVRRIKRHRQSVERLADRVHQHWVWLHEQDRHLALHNADICSAFSLPPADMPHRDTFPRLGTVP